MALHTRKQFAALCRTTTAVITTNINRGKIVLFDKKIDDENKINVKFFNAYNKKAEEAIKKRNAEDKARGELYNDVVEKATKTVIIKAKNTKTEKERKKAVKESKKTIDWDKREKEASVLLKERKAAKELMQLEKLAGKLMPTDMSIDIVRVHNQSIFSVFQNNLENQASIFCDILAAGDRKLLGKITEALSKDLNDCITRAKDVALSAVENIVEEYSETRSRGERK